MDNVEPLVERLRKRAEIRRQIQTRKSVQEGKPDRLADLLEEAAMAIQRRDWIIDRMKGQLWMAVIVVAAIPISLIVGALIKGLSGP